MRPSVYAFVVIVSLATNCYADDAEHKTKPRVITERIGSLDNARFTVPQAINERGQVVGFADDAAGHSVAFLWTRRDGFRRIVDDAQAWDVNDRGDVVGSWFQCFDFDGERECGHPFGFLWTRNEGFRDLGSFVPFAINKHRDMAGFCDLVGVFHACVMLSGMVNVVGDENTQAYAIDNRGDAVGGSSGTGEAFLWRRDGMVIGLGPGVARSINSRGAVAGWRNGPAGSVATLWTKAGTFSPPLSGGSAISGINSRGDMVGGHEGKALFWNAKTGLVLEPHDANRPASASDINDRQVIVGSSRGPNAVEMVLWRLQHGAHKAPGEK